MSKNTAPMPDMAQSLLTKSAVLERPGWSATLVARLLGDPDQRKKVLGRSTLLALYAVTRVETAEASAEFEAAQKALAKRKAAAQKAVATKTAQLLEAIQAMPIAVQEWSLRAVRQGAIDSYNLYNQGDSFASRDDDPAFLDRITVNFIRHELTQYDSALWEAAGKTGVVDAAFLLRKRIYEAIAKTYPALQAECERQLQERSRPPMARCRPSC